MSKADFNRYFVAFGRGPRSCVGINLAYAELYLTLATLYRPGGPRFEAWETDDSDLTVVHDFFAPYPRLDSKGVRMMIK